MAAGSSPTPLIVLRDAGPADARALPPLHAAAFPTPAEADLVARLLDGHDVLFSLVAEQHRRPVGHALITAMTHEQGGSVRGLAALAPVAVHPDHQRQGIGTALVHEAVRQSREHRVAALFVLGDPRFYAPLGFIPAAEHGLTSAFGPAHAFQMIHLQPQRPLPPGRVHHAPEFVDLPA
ncbi:MAG: N-acetyltransferase [Planctomycetota bacterium]